MRKTIKLFCFMVCICLVFSYATPYSTAIGGNELEKESTETQTHQYKVANCQLTNVTQLSTTDLLAEVLAYPYLFDIFLYNDFDAGINHLSERYNGLHELLQRSDASIAVATLLSHCNSDITTFNIGQRVLLQKFTREINSWPQYVSTTVYTPLHSAVSALLCVSDFSYNDLQELDAYIAVEYPDIIACLRNSTGMYNCHSYAWYNRSSSNEIWIDYPMDFKTDCYTPQATWASGDILVYSNNGEDIHSAVIESTDGTLSGTVVVSKWGSTGLYRHTADYSPYDDTTTYTAYRLCAHSYGDAFPINVYVHGYTCSICGYVQQEVHDLNQFNRCTICGFRGIPIEPNGTDEPCE